MYDDMLFTSFSVPVTKRHFKQVILHSFVSIVHSLTLLIFRQHCLTTTKSQQINISHAPLSPLTTRKDRSAAVRSRTAGADQRTPASSSSSVTKWGSRISRDRFDIESPGFTRISIQTYPTATPDMMSLNNYFRSVVLAKNHRKCRLRWLQVEFSSRV